MKKDFENELLNRNKYTKEEKEIIKALGVAVRELEEARKFFEVTDNPDLINYAIYRESAAQAKYVYLLNQAKNKNIKINSYLLEKEDEVI